jgi:hypothetical protein
MEENPVPTWDSQNPYKQLFQSSLVRETKENHANKGSRDPASGSLFLHWEVAALGTDPLNLKN